jgi:tellurite resistance protein TerC
MLFPWSGYAHWYFAFALILLVLVFIDLRILYKKKACQALKASLPEALVWIGLGVLFGVLLYFYMAYVRGVPQVAHRVFAEYMTGFIIEKALALDNIFVFIVIFRSLSIDVSLQPIILLWGIVGAIVFRAILIALGSYVLQFGWVELALGVLLVITGLKVVLSPHKAVAVHENRLLRWLMQSGRVGPAPEGVIFFFKASTGRWMLTPAALALIAVECTDVVFALDSVPAIFAITREPFIVFTSNVFAILGLRALYGCVSQFIERFYYLKYGLGAILIFAGCKMAWLNAYFGGHFPLAGSLGFIVLALILPVLIQSAGYSKKG